MKQWKKEQSGIGSADKDCKLTKSTLRYSWEKELFMGGSKSEDGSLAVCNLWITTSTIKTNNLPPIQHDRNQDDENDDENDGENDENGDQTYGQVWFELCD